MARNEGCKGVALNQAIYSRIYPILLIGGTILLSKSYCTRRDWGGISPFPPLSSRASLFHCKSKMADHPGAPPAGGGGGGVPIGPAPNPAGDTPATSTTTTMVIMPPSPAATRLFSDVRKGLEKSATGKLFVVCLKRNWMPNLPCLGGVDPH